MSTQVSPPKPLNSPEPINSKLPTEASEVPDKSSIGKTLASLTSNDDKKLFDKKLYEKFDNQLMDIKVFFIVLLVAASVVNRDSEFIMSNPGIFSTECVIYGITASLPFVYMEYQRKKETKSPIMIFAICFTIISVCHILLQLGGFYKNSEKENCDKPVESKESSLFDNIKESTKGTSSIVLTSIILYICFIAYNIYDFKIENYQNNYYMWFTIETLLFALCNTLPLLYIKNNRQLNNEYQKDFKQKLFESFLLFIKFAILHLLLQSSNLYKHSFGWN